MSSSEKGLSNPASSNQRGSTPTGSGTRFSWRNGGRVLAVMIPTLIGLHYVWFQMQFMEEIIPEDKRKKVMRVGPLLIDKEKNFSLVKAEDFFVAHEKEDRKAGK